MHDAQNGAAQAAAISASDTIRDLRCGDWAWFSKAVLEMKLGWKANLVYMGLVAYANSNNQTCFPSKGTLADLLGVSKTTIFEGVQALKEAKLIEVNERKNGDITLSNEYTLLPIPHAQYAPPMRNTNGGVVRNTHPPMRNTHGNKNNQQELKENNKTPVVPSTQKPAEPVKPAEPDSADARILCEVLGIFNIREQEAMHRCYRACAKVSSKNPETTRQHMWDRWKEYQKAIPDLEWSYGSAYKFFMSGNWDTPSIWPRAKPTGNAKPDPFANMKFINSGGNKK